jgi:small GTP-binding protein
MIIVGQAGAGKSCLLNRFIADEFAGTGGYTPTLGAEMQSKIVEMEDTKIKLQIWDTAGQESFRSVVKTFYRDSAAIFFVYNIAE